MFAVKLSMAQLCPRVRLAPGPAQDFAPARLPWTGALALLRTERCGPGGVTLSARGRRLLQRSTGAAARGTPTRQAPPDKEAAEGRGARVLRRLLRASWARLGLRARLRGPGAQVSALAPGPAAGQAVGVSVPRAGLGPESSA